MLRNKRNSVSILIAFVLVTFLAPVSGEAGGSAGPRAGWNKGGLWQAAWSWLAEAWKGLRLEAGLAAETGAATAVPDGGMDAVSPGKPIEDARPARGSAIDPNGSL